MGTTYLHAVATVDADIADERDGPRHDRYPSGDQPLVPVLLGRGRRLLDSGAFDRIEFDLVRTLDAPGVLHLRHEVGYR
jgi:hypothetical protein